MSEITLSTALGRGDTTAAPCPPYTGAAKGDHIMRKNLILISLTLIAIMFLYSCSDVSEAKDTSALPDITTVLQHGTDNATLNAAEKIPSQSDHGNVSPVGSGYDKSTFDEPPVENSCWSFRTIEEYLNAISEDGPEEYAELRKTFRFKTLKNEGAPSSAEKTSGGTPTPKIDGATVTLRDKEGYPGISCMVNDLYDYSWTWYHCVMGDQEFTVRISDSGELDSLNITANDSYVDVLAKIASDAPSPSNYKEFEAYERIYEENLTLAGGNNVEAMISEMKNSSEIYVMFHSQGALICVTGSSQLLNDAFWSVFSIDLE